MEWVLSLYFDYSAYRYVFQACFMYKKKVHKKITVPTALQSAKTVIRMRDQGFEPWTP